MCQHGHGVVSYSYRRKASDKGSGRFRCEAGALHRLSGIISTGEG